MTSMTPAAYADRVGSPGGLQGQQHCLRHALSGTASLPRPPPGPGNPRPAAPAASPGTPRTPGAARRSPPRPDPAPAADAPVRRPPPRRRLRRPGRSGRPARPLPPRALNTSTGTRVPSSATGSRATVISTRAAPTAGTNGRSRPRSSASSNTSRQRLPSASSQCRSAWPASAAPCREPPSDSAVASATAANPASRLSLSRALTHAISRQPPASLARAYAAASWVLPTPRVPVSTTTGGSWLARFSCASSAGLGWRPGR